jgi:hypothetical protein
MHLITVRASDAVVIAKNSAERQCEVQGIPISVPLTGYPLNNYHRTITIDFRNESIYFCLLKDGKAFVECVIAFIMSIGFQLTHKVTWKGGGLSDTSLALCACPAGRGHHLASPVHHVQSGIHRAPSLRFALSLSAPGGGP